MPKFSTAALILISTLIYAYDSSAQTKSTVPKDIFQDQEPYKYQAIRLPGDSIHVEFYDVGTRFYSIDLDEYIAEYEGPENEKWTLFLWYVMEDAMVESDMLDLRAYYDRIKKEHVEKEYKDDVRMYKRGDNGGGGQ